MSIALLVLVVSSLNNQYLVATPAGGDQVVSIATPIGSVAVETAVKRAVLDYVEGVYDVKPEFIERSVAKDLSKFGFWRPENEEEFKSGTTMTFEQLMALSGNYNKDGHIKVDAPKEVIVLDVMDKIASAKLNAAWGTDYFHLVKRNGKWKIRHVVWQSPPPKK